MFQRILWPVDGSPLSFKPAEEIIDLAKIAEGKIIVLSIAEPDYFILLSQSTCKMVKQRRR